MLDTRQTRSWNCGPPTKPHERFEQFSRYGDFFVSWLGLKVFILLPILEIFRAMTPKIGNIVKTPKGTFLPGTICFDIYRSLKRGHDHDSKKKKNVTCFICAYTMQHPSCHVACGPGHSQPYLFNGKLQLHCKFSLLSYDVVCL